MFSFFFLCLLGYKKKNMENTASSHFLFDRIFKTAGARLTLALWAFVGAEVGISFH